MSDKTTIVGTNGEARYVVRDNKVEAVLDHEHVFDELTELCQTCKKSKLELIQKEGQEDEHRSS